MVVSDLSVTFHAGTRRVLRVTIVDDDTTGSPAFPLTGGEIVKFNLARLSNGIPLKANPLIDFRSDVSAQVVITDAANGIVEIELLPADTAALLVTSYSFQVEVYTSLDANPVMVSEGTITLLTNTDNV